jgi:hypothetical protein
MGEDRLLPADQSSQLCSMAKMGLKITSSSHNATVANGMGAARRSNARIGEAPSVIAPLLPGQTSLRLP